MAGALTNSGSAYHRRGHRVVQTDGRHTVQFRIHPTGRRQRDQPSASRRDHGRRGLRHGGNGDRVRCCPPELCDRIRQRADHHDRRLFGIAPPRKQRLRRGQHGAGLEQRSGPGSPTSRGPSISRAKWRLGVDDRGADQRRTNCFRSAVPCRLAARDPHLFSLVRRERSTALGPSASPAPIFSSTRAFRPARPSTRAARTRSRSSRRRISPPRLAVSGPATRSTRRTFSSPERRSISPRIRGTLAARSPSTTEV